MLRYITLLFSCFILIAFSCDEIPPTLNPDTGGPNVDVPVELQKRQVIIEEFTGVHCVNCPAGSQVIEVLKESYGPRLVAVSIHAGFYATPYPESNQDLATTLGASIQSFLENPIGYPTGVINRKHFSGEESRQLTLSSWAGYIAEELMGDPVVKIDLQPTYNETTREVTIDVDLYIEENITEDDVRVSLFITEDNIIDLQLTPDSVDVNYAHKHVFRDAITSFSGDVLSEALTAGSVVSQSFTYTLPAIWQAEECHIVSVVHLGGEVLDALQAHEVKIVE